MNHAPAILAAPDLIYSTHRLSVVWITVAHFHFCSLLDRYTVLEVWAVRQLMRVCCGSRWGWCVLFINILDSLTAPCLVYNTAMYTVYGRCGQYGRCMVHTLAGAAAVDGAAGGFTAFSLPGQFAPRSESANRTPANSLPGTFAPWPIRSMALSLPGTFAPRPFRSLAFSLLD